MPDDHRKIALSLPCRHKRCGAPAGILCNHARKGALHQVRWNDATRLMKKLEKAREWETLYGDQST